MLTKEEFNKIQWSLPSTHPIIMFKIHENFALSASLGFPTGIDGTFHLNGKTYLTGGPSYNGAAFHKQLIVQRRLLDGNPIGFSIGSIVTHQNVPDNTRYFLGGGDENMTTSIGGRSVLMITDRTPYSTARPFLYLTGSINYDLKNRCALPNAEYCHWLLLILIDMVIKL